MNKTFDGKYELTNVEAAKKLNELTKKMHNVEVECNYYDNLLVTGKIEDVQKVIAELVDAGLTVLQNEIPAENTPFYDGHMAAIVGRVA